MLSCCVPKSSTKFLCTGQALLCSLEFPSTTGVSVAALLANLGATRFGTVTVAGLISVQAASFHGIACGSMERIVFNLLLSADQSLPLPWP